MIRRFIREKVFAFARHDLAKFLENHEEDLVEEFRIQIRRMDQRIPDEESYIDIRMAPFGETILRASLKAIREFLRKNEGTAEIRQEQGEVTE